VRTDTRELAELVLGTIGELEALREENERLAREPDRVGRILREEGARSIFSTCVYANEALREGDDLESWRRRATFSVPDDMSRNEMYEALDDLYRTAYARARLRASGPLDGEGEDAS
jgi:hypothetical protein